MKISPFYQQQAQRQQKMHAGDEHCYGQSKSCPQGRQSQCKGRQTLYYETVSSQAADDMAHLWNKHSNKQRQSKQNQGEGGVLKRELVPTRRQE
jgi:hypothetical protein